MILNYEIVLLIWSFIIIMSAVSIVIFNTLVILRFFRDSKQQKDQKRKDEIREKLLLNLENPLRNLKKSVLKDRNDMRLVVEVSAELLKLLRGKSYMALIKSLSEIGIYDYIKKELHSKNLKSCISVIGISAHWPGNEMQKRLISLLSNKNRLIRYPAVEALSYSKDPKIFPIIAKEIEKSTTLSYSMISNIFQRFGSQIAPELAKLITKKHSIKIKRAAMLALIKEGGAEILKKVALPLCVNKDEELRSLAFCALADKDIVITMDLLKKGAKDKSWKVRRNAARCASSLFPKSAEILMKFLKDENWLVGLQAGKSLFAAGVGGQKLLEAIALNQDIQGVRAKMILEEGGQNVN